MKRNDPISGGLAGLLFSLPALAQEDQQYVAAHGATVPATYTGAIEDETLHLDLWPDQAFHLLRTTGVGATEASAGRWHADGRSIVLRLGNDETLTLEVRNADRLRPVGAPDDASGDLVSGSLKPAAISLQVAGMFTYYADAPSFEHCATGRVYAVGQEGDYLALERAYLEDRLAATEPLFVTLDATIAMRPQMEGSDSFAVLVDAFDATWPGETCARAASAPRLSGTVWRIHSVGGRPMEWAPPAREPFLTMDAEGARFNASVGCNMFLGGIVLAENGSLSFGPAATTMMACPNELANQEAALSAALERTAGYRIGGRTLRLLDASGAELAELEAVYLP